MTLPTLRHVKSQPPPGSAGARHSTLPDGCHAIADILKAAAAAKVRVRLINMNRYPLSYCWVHSGGVLNNRLKGVHFAKQFLSVKPLKNLSPIKFIKFTGKT